MGNPPRGKFVWVGVFGQLGPRYYVHEGDGHGLGVDHAGREATGDLKRWNIGEGILHRKRILEQGKVQ